jgi:transcriptional antiterminator RfaH
MNDELVRRIRLFEEDRNHATLMELSQLKSGQTVRLKHTALAGVEGLIQSVSTKRVAVLLEILGRPTIVQLEHHQVELSES